MGIKQPLEAYALDSRLGDATPAVHVLAGGARRVDYAADGTPVGVELLCADQGVDLSGLPHPDRIAEVLRGHAARILG